MTKPKRWYLDFSNVDDNTELSHYALVLKFSDGTLIRKPNATAPLGDILSVEVPAGNHCGKYSSVDCVLFRCEKGRIVLSLKYHEWNKTAVSSIYSNVSSSNEFVMMWNEEIATTTSERESFVTRSSQKRSIVELDATSSPTTSIVLESATSAKKCKYTPEGIDENIEKCRKGLMQLPLKQLVLPPKEHRLLRDPDQTFVKHLKQKMLADPAAPGATPMAVLCKDVEEFNSKYKDVYKYEVLGGSHTMLAKCQLSEEYPENPYFKVAMAEVYIGLSDEEALRLAQRHNLNSHFVHKLTHKDLIKACRSRLYAMEFKAVTEECPKPSASWKESCKKAIIPDSISNTQRDSVYYQASLPKKVWDLALEVIDLFEQAKLKGQKLNLSALTSKPEFKQQYLAPIRTLEEDEQCDLLQKVVDREISLTELKSESFKMKQLRTLRTAFVKLTNADSWQDAQSSFPVFATTEQMTKFIHLDVKRSIPKSFTDFCMRAKNSISNTLPDMNGDVFLTEFGTLYSLVLKDIVTEISGSRIKSKCTTFSGASLALVNISKEYSREDTESTLYTVKEINSVAGCHVFTVACLCEMEQLHEVEEVAKKVSFNTEVLFWCNGDIQERNEFKLARCVKAVVLCFFSVNDTICQQHFYYEEGESRTNFVVGSALDLYTYVIKHFCQPKSVVLDFSCSITKGLSTICVINCDRSCVSIVDDCNFTTAVEKLTLLQQESEE